MHNTMNFVLLLFAAIFFGLYAFSIIKTRVHLLALGLLCWVLVPLFQAFNRL